jgi:hypothetical protein
MPNRKPLGGSCTAPVRDPWRGKTRAAVSSVGLVRRQGLAAQVRVREVPGVRAIFVAFFCSRAQAHSFKHPRLCSITCRSDFRVAIIIQVRPEAVTIPRAPVLASCAGAGGAEFLRQHKPALSAGYPKPAIDPALLGIGFLGPLKGISIDGFLAPAAEDFGGAPGKIFVDFG